MRKIRVAQIGTSIYGHGNSIFEAMKKQPDVFEIVGYTFPENERKKFPDMMPCFDGYEELSLEQILEDETIEAVCIETEEIYLTKYALLAAQHGKHIQMEKPGGLSLEEFEQLIDTMKQTGKVFHTGYMYRYNPTIEGAVQHARSGKLGDIISVEAQMSGWRGEEMTKWLEVFDGGMMFYLGCHMIDLVLRIQGMPKRILTFNKASRYYDTDAKDNCTVIFEYEKGASFIKTSQRERGGFKRRQLVITGTEGTVEIRPLEASVAYPLQYTGYLGTLSDKWSATGEWTKAAVHDRYNDMMRAFAEMVAGEKENPISYDYELELYKTILKCCE